MRSYPTLTEWRSISAAQDSAFILIWLVVALIIAAYLWLHARPVGLRLWHIVALGAVLRMPLMAGSFWYDETFSASVAGMSLDGLRSVVLGDVHPPLPYLIQWIIARGLGNGELAMRLPAYLAGVAIIPAIYRLGWMHIGPRPATWAALLMAIMPAAIYYSSEARQYSLLALIVLGALIMASRRDWRAWPILALLPVIHAHGYLYAAAIGLWMMATQQPRPWRMAIIAALPGVVWLPAMLLQARDVADGFWMGDITAGAALRWLSDMTIGLQMPPEIMLMGLVTVAALTIGSIWAWRQIDFKGMHGLIVVSLGVPLATIVISLAWHNILLPRALLPAAMLWLLAWGWLLAYHPASRLSLPIIALAALMAISHPDYQRADYRTWIAQACGDEKLIYTVSPATSIIASYYSDADVYLWDEMESHDLNQQLPRPALEAFGVRLVGSAPSGACILYQDNPLMTEAQRDEVAQATEGLARLDIFASGTLAVYAWRPS